MFCSSSARKGGEEGEERRTFNRGLIFNLFHLLVFSTNQNAWFHQLVVETLEMFESGFKQFYVTFPVTPWPLTFWLGPLPFGRRSSRVPGAQKQKTGEVSRGHRGRRRASGSASWARRFSYGSRPSGRWHEHQVWRTSGRWSKGGGPEQGLQQSGPPTGTSTWGTRTSRGPIMWGPITWGPNSEFEFEGPGVARRGSNGPNGPTLSRLWMWADSWARWRWCGGK